jgi:hypothetical protein
VIHSGGGGVKKLNIAIVGAGWYGCHLALSLLQAGHEVTLFEATDSTISGASRKNQNRLHLGFHYPRNYPTREQSRDGFEWFQEHYSHLVETIDNNLYAIASQSSYIDFPTYLQILTASELPFSVQQQAPVALQNIEGLIRVGEKLVRNDLASRYFNRVLAAVLQLNTRIDLADPAVYAQMTADYDYVLDCSWGTARKISGFETFYEPCIYFYYRCLLAEPFALTIMDGQFFSLYPYVDDIFTLTSVAHTPIGRADSMAAVAALFASAQQADFVAAKRAAFEREVAHFYPDFLQHFSFHACEYSLKTKVVSGSDFRGCLVTQSDNYISVFSGKIDTLHIAEMKVFEIIT